MSRRNTSAYTQAGAQAIYGTPVFPITTKVEENKLGTTDDVRKVTAFDGFENSIVATFPKYVPLG